MYNFLSSDLRSVVMSFFALFVLVDSIQILSIFNPLSKISFNKLTTFLVVFLADGDIGAFSIISKENVSGRVFNLSKP